MQRRFPGFRNKDQKNVRLRYEDTSRRFEDWVNRLGLEKTRFGRFLIYLEEKFQVRLLSAMFIYCFLLAYFLTVEIEAPMDYKLGEHVPVTITSPISFQMTDEVTTEDKRIRAEEKVLPIFDYDASVMDKVSHNIYESFREMRQRLKSIKWPTRESEREEVYKEFFKHKSEFDKLLGVVLPDPHFEWLVKNRFSARIENLLIRSLENWFDNKVADAPERFISDQYLTVTLRHVQKHGKGREQVIDKQELNDLQSEEAFTLPKVKGVEKLSIENREVLFSIARLLLFPNVTPNKQETALRRQQARESVIPVVITIKKNQPVVAEGAEITPANLAVLKEIQYLKAEKRQDMMALVAGFMFVVLMVVLHSYLRRYSLSKIKISHKDLVVMAIILLGEVIVTKLFLFMTEGAFVGKFGQLVPSNFFVYLAPVAAGPMLVGLLVTAGEVVFMYTLFLSFVMGLMLEMNFAFALVSLAGGIAAARGVFSCKARNDIYWAGLRTGLVNAVVISCLIVLERFDQPNFLRDWLMIIPAGFISGIMSSMLALIFVSVLESVFNYTTDVKLLELSNLNHPLLKEMIVKAPGTYHHSMMVGSMVEAASEEIGANPLLAKVMAYYHDIGKIEHANYFIENQKSGVNPHDSISPYMSKTLLVAHVKDGVELGLKHKLGQVIIDGVVQHHGTTLISYFYNKALDAAEKTGGEVPEDEFRYPGPKPQFREAALIMLADSIEAAARSLDEPTPVRLQNIVRNIIQKKFTDGQLDECNLTLKDLTKVEQAFVRILLGIYHQRIDYPRSAGGGLGDVEAKPLKVAPRGAPSA